VRSIPERARPTGRQSTFLDMTPGPTLVGHAKMTHSKLNDRRQSRCSVGPTAHRLTTREQSDPQVHTSRNRGVHMVSRSMRWSPSRMARRASHPDGGDNSTSWDRPTQCPVSRTLDPNRLARERKRQARGPAGHNAHRFHKHTPDANYIPAWNVATTQLR